MMVANNNNMTAVSNRMIKCFSANDRKQLTSTNSNKKTTKSLKNNEQKEKTTTNNYLHSIFPFALAECF